MRKEAVVLKSPGSVRALHEAADQYREQFVCIARVHIRGSVRDEDGMDLFLEEWQEVVVLSDVLDLVGLGELVVNAVPSEQVWPSDVSTCPPM
ncbi:hypothetical protein [Ktedonobacter racemifer]|uniref:Uncharacterized protein n=1 Tax=Ktedonobacter racemifer DSM 44963 TaxID=485913 RepID=D6TCT5_KTERA|nr:hypothetical protein [Ktedonobacter racemifer]EFH88199.1 hypothetical protein Krac_9612 [Ktedonobacter racemifer DSM 44963]